MDRYIITGGRALAIRGVPCSIARAADEVDDDEDPATPYTRGEQKMQVDSEEGHADAPKFKNKQNANANACSGCGDTGLLWSCTSPGCTKRVCVMKKDDQLPCLLGLLRVVQEESFMCPQCMFKARTPIPYVINCHALSYLTQTVHTDPLAVLFLIHGALEGNYIVNQVLTQLQEDFVANPSNLEFAITHLRSGESKVYKLRPAHKPLANFIGDHGATCRFLLVIATHSDYLSGWLVHGKAKSSGDIYVAPADEVVDQFMSYDLKRQLEGVQGLRGALLLACGSSMKQTEHFHHVKQLVSRGTFDFVVGFSAQAVVPRVVGPALVMALQQAFIYGRDIFQSIFDAVTATHHVLNHTPVVVIFRNGDRVESRCIVYSIPHVKLWGLEHRCINEKCDKPGNIRSKCGHGVNHAWGQFECICCKWRSRWLKRPVWLHETGKNFFFWHDYPLTDQQADYIIYEHM